MQVPGLVGNERHCAPYELFVHTIDKREAFGRFFLCRPIAQKRLVGQIKCLLDFAIECVAECKLDKTILCRKVGCNFILASTCLPCQAKDYHSFVPKKNNKPIRMVHPTNKRVLIIRAPRPVYELIILPPRK